MELQIASRCVLAVCLLVSVVLTGCGVASSSGKRSEGDRQQPASPEQEMFSVMSRYYCEHKSWPATLEQLEAFDQSVNEAPIDIRTFKNPTLEASRAVVLTLGYDNELGVRRKISFIAPPRCDDEKTDGEISIAAGRIRFEVPTGFALMGGEAVKQRWRAAPFPDAAWRDERGILIAIRFGDVEVQPAELVSLDASLTEAYESSVPSLVWVRKGPREVEGRVLLEHAFESDSSTGKLVNFVVSTSFDGKLLAITMTGNSQDVDRVDAIVQKVETSLRID